MKRMLVTGMISLLMSCLLPLAAVCGQTMSEEVAKRLVDLTSCIEYLEKTGNLVRVKSEVDPRYELAGIAKKFEGKKCET